VRRGDRPPEIFGGTSSGAGPRTHSERWELIHGRSEEVLPLLPAHVFDACITDPPYGIGVADWDHEVPGPEAWQDVLRVLKPGAPLVAFAGRRNYHRMAIAVEDAAFRVVDQAIWIFRTGRRPSRGHLKPAHELILIARAPGKPSPVNIDDARIPFRDEADRVQVGRIDTLRATGRRRAVYAPSLDGFGREGFRANDNGREPTTVMATDDVLGEASHVFVVPKVRNVLGHPCSKPPELLRHLVKLFVPPGGLLVDPFAGAGPMVPVIEELRRRAVLIEMARAA
jgi:DNA modification methylase